MTLQAAPAPPGWYPDPYSSAHQRWWDGRQWTLYTSIRPQRPRRTGWVIAIAVGAVLVGMLAVLGVGVAAVALSQAGSQAAGDPPVGTPTLVSDALSSTVRIEASSCGPGCVYEGAGVAVGPTQILTAEHVVEGVDSVVIYDRAGNSMQGTVVRRDAQTDLALVQTSPHGLPVAGLLSTDTAPGDPLWVIGASAWVSDPITSGRVLKVSDECADGVLDVTTSAEVEGGDSGGPMVDEQGLVVGITKSAPAHGVGGAATAASEIQSFLALDQSAFDTDGYLTRPEDRDEGYCRYVD